MLKAFAEPLWAGACHQVHQSVQETARAKEELGLRLGLACLEHQPAGVYSLPESHWTTMLQQIGGHQLRSYEPRGECRHPLGTVYLLQDKLRRLYRLRDKQFQCMMMAADFLACLVLGLLPLECTRRTSIRRPGLTRTVHLSTVEISSRMVQCPCLSEEFQVTCIRTDMEMGGSSGGHFQDLEPQFLEQERTALECHVMVRESLRSECLQHQL